jgi:hypothetical protein
MGIYFPASLLDGSHGQGVLGRTCGLELQVNTRRDLSQLGGISLCLSFFFFLARLWIKQMELWQPFWNVRYSSTC